MKAAYYRRFNKIMDVQFIVLMLVQLAVQGAYSLPITCTSSSTSSTSLATNMTTWSGWFSCFFTQEPSFILGGCSVTNATSTTFASTRAAAVTKATYSCSFVDTSARPLTELVEETLDCSGLFSIATSSTASPGSTSIQGNDSCSLAATIIADNTTTSLLHLQYDVASHCVSSSTTAGAPFPNATASTSSCSVVSRVSNGPTTLLTSNETTNCTTIDTTAFSSSARFVQKSISLCFLNLTTTLANTTPHQYKGALAHGAMFALLA